MRDGIVPVLFLYLKALDWKQTEQNKKITMNFKAINSNTVLCVYTLKFSQKT